jgi:type IV pilus assembly protein PilY1
MTDKLPARTSRFAARALAVLFAGTELIVPGVALATDLADVPMAVANTVRPNVMFLLDDSGSMKFEVLPESDDIYLTFPISGNRYGTAYYNNGTFDATPRFTLTNRYARCFRNAQCNLLYYNPTIRYRPWVDSTGTERANATPAAAWHNPDNVGEGTINLTVNNTATENWRNDDGSLTNESLTFYPATYFRFTGTGAAPTTVGATANVQANYTRVQIISTTASYTHNNAPNRTDCSLSGTTATCTYTQEIQNFANWYSYYRSRILAARAGIGRAFSRQQDNSMRVGFGTINKGDTSVDNVNTNTIVSGVRNFSGSDRTNFFTTLYGRTMPNEGTPLPPALRDAGVYFSRTDNRGPWGENPGSPDGTQWSCRQNYTILMTDGYWNENVTGIDNADGTSGATISRPTGSTLTPASFTYSPANPFNDAYSNTLADVAMYYWKRDLRAGTGALANNVPTDPLNPAFWQHMVTYTVGFGVTGTIAKSTIDTAFTSLQSGTPATMPTINWPNPTSSNAARVDDLAHAAINGRGGYYSAADPETFANSLTAALDDVIGRTGAAAAVSVANADVSVDNTSYASQYNSGNWTGQLASYPIDAATGIVSTTASWTAQSQLDLLGAANRRIVTRSATANSGIQFQPNSGSTATKLSTDQMDLLKSTTTPPGPSDGEAVLAYTRGDDSQEGTTYRTRAYLLGDIVNAEPTVVTTPGFEYNDAGYAAFRTAQTVGVTGATRVKSVFQPANDGMVHAFNATTGAESWAYIPSFVLPKLSDRARKTGFIHEYLIDATAMSGDVDFDKTGGAAGTGTPAWRTLLVGGLGKGGRGYYALNVTTPTATSEADAASKVLWEFPTSSISGTYNLTTPSGYTANGLTFNANKIGFSYGRPVIVKTRAYGWVVLVTSGYNNGTGSGAAGTGGDGRGYLFVLNAQTGALLHVFDTAAGTGATPSGLAHISAFVQNPLLDNTVEYVYGGDLLGNVWRFDLSSSVPGGATSPTVVPAWSVRQVAALVDGSGNAQPVTTEPELARSDEAGVEKRMIFVGTGQYLGTTDVPGSTGANTNSNQTQTMYGLVDDLSTTPLITPLRSRLQAQVLSTGTATRTTSTGTVVTSPRGWYVDLPQGERVSTNPALALGLLYFTSNKPSTDPCVPGGSSWLNVFDYLTGGQVQGAAASGTFIGNVLSSRPITIQLPDGSVKVLIRTSDGMTPTFALPYTPRPIRTRRGGWKIVPRM